MPVTSRQSRRLSDADLQRLLKLLKGVDSVELKLKFTPGDFGRRLVAELWLYPNGSRILELSTKCAPGEAFQGAAESRAFLAGKGVDLTGEQQTKTRTALTYFSHALKVTADA